MRLSIGMVVFKQAAQLVFISLQVVLLAMHQVMSGNLFSTDNIWSYMLLIDIILTFIFYGYTTLKDPGYVPILEYQYSETSQPNQRKKFGMSQNPMVIVGGNILPDEHAGLQVEQPKQELPKNNIEFEMECEQSVEEEQESQNHIDMNQMNSFTKSHDPSKQQSRVVSKYHSPHEIKTSTQILSQSSTKADKQQQSDRKVKQCTSMVVQHHQQNLNLNDSALDSHSPNTKHALEQIQDKMSMDQTDIHIGNTMFIEKRYCPYCNQEQMVRSKHCRFCKRCVALYDHHCPWTGNCIGEGNRCSFYWFLTFQLIELISVLSNTFSKLELQSLTATTQIFYVMIIILSVAFTAMVGSLFLFHSLLSFQNMTTWEYKSWKKISYLKDFPKQMGSPFSKGWKDNIRLFCRFSVPQITIWEYNSSLQMNNIK